MSQRYINEVVNYVFALQFDNVVARRPMTRRMKAKPVFVKETGS
jgi:hypothetical protein